ncbi:TPA: plasmid mobilization relaxosome protein MobC [Enterococcus faecium]
MARPKKEFTRPYRITIRFTDVEYEHISDTAKEARLTLSEYIRKMALEGKLTFHCEVVADMTELQKLTNEIGNIGSNLNQIAKYFNTGGIRSNAMEAEIRNCISQLFSLRKEIVKIEGNVYGSVETSL